MADINLQVDVAWVKLALLIIGGIVFFIGFLILWQYLFFGEKLMEGITYMVGGSILMIFSRLEEIMEHIPYLN